MVLSTAGLGVALTGSPFRASPAGLSGNVVARGLDT